MYLEDVVLNLNTHAQNEDRKLLGIFSAYDKEE